MPAPSHDQSTFNLTLIQEASLARRLAQGLEFLALEVQLEWNSLIKNPSGHCQRRFNDACRFAGQWIWTTNRVSGIATSLTIILIIALLVFTLERSRPRELAHRNGEPSESETLLTMLQPEQRVAAVGFADQESGRVGMSNGRGEGSNPEPRPARGGGGSGNRENTPAQKGAVPPPSEIPGPLLAVPLRNPVLPAAGIKIDPLLWKALPEAKYGDPRSQSQFASQGPGTGDVIGSGDGFGLGEGRGPGVGPGSDGNTGTGPDQRGGEGIGGGPGCGVPPCLNGNLDRILTIRDVTVRARVLAKPEPQYTEEARKNLITGTVSLRVVFSKTGDVIDIRAIRSLPLGPTERAIAAARQIRFIPATRDGKPVSVYMQLEYNFNLY